VCVCVIMCIFTLIQGLQSAEILVKLRRRNTDLSYNKTLKYVLN
jgi:hypothetical protein